MIPNLRVAGADDLPVIASTAGRAFGISTSPDQLEDLQTHFEPDRFLLACDVDDGAVVGVTGSVPFDVTLPGGAALPAAGVAWVAVLPTHRRRGILRALMAEQHRGFAAAGTPLSLLTASEGGIYGRFGYGLATRERAVEIDRRFVTFRADAPDPGEVRFVDAEEARKLAPDIHRRWCAISPAALSRSERTWDVVFRDTERRRGEASALFHLAHPNGYASYRITHGARRGCRIVDLFAATDDAHAALWRVLLGLDLVETVSTTACPLDDPLPQLLTDARQVRTTELGDGLWARVLDVAAALAARRYAVEVDVVLDVADPFLDSGGRFRLRGGPDGASCERVDGPAEKAADLTVGVAALGSLLMGTQRAGTLARARLLDAVEPGVLARVDLAFGSDREPRHGTDF